MGLSERITDLRKKNGWSQEELAEKLGVSRQAVSKWESGQATPDLDKVINLSNVFGVTTDYLLKDEEFTPSDEKSDDIPIIDEKYAKRFIDTNKRNAKLFATATFLCVISPITLIILGGLSDSPSSKIGEIFASIAGLCVLFALVIVGVSLFVYGGLKGECYEFFEKDTSFKLTLGARDYVRGEKKKSSDRFVKINIIATSLCIASPIPLIVSAFFENEVIILFMLGALLLTVGVGSGLFVLSGVESSAYNKLLQEGDYTKENKKINKN